MKKDLLFKISITAVMTALCFALTYVSIPLPTGAKVHLGNFVCVLAGMLCGGVVGGVVGSLGMGLNDLSQGYGANTIIRTFIVKFFLGFIVGVLFKLLINRNKASKITLYSVTGALGLSFIFTLVGYLTASPIYTYVKDGKTVKTFTYQEGATLVSGTKGCNITLGESTKMLEISVLTPIFLGILTAILLGIILFLIIYKKKKKDYQGVETTVATVTAISVVVNTALEFFLRWLINGIVNNNFTAALVESITKLPSNVITGVVTIIAVTIVYLPLYYALRNSGFGKYLITIKDNKTEEIAETSKSEEL